MHVTIEEKTLEDEEDGDICVAYAILRGIYSKLENSLVIKNMNEETLKS